MATVSPFSPELSERDLLPVRDLIEEVRIQEQHVQLLAATITWLNAFSAFKRMRQRYGLPQDPAATQDYREVLAALRATGETLLLCFHQGLLAFDQAPVDARNFEACVGELQDDERLLASGLLAASADLRDAETAFGLR